MQLAQPGDLNKHYIGGWYVSEKLDGQRCLWDGGITRGMAIKSVPWANIEKIERFVDQNIISTGLWTRYGHPIAAPDWWLDKLALFPLDGELWMGRGMFQDLMSTTRRLEPVTENWKQVRYMIFDAPAYSEIFQLGEIREVHYHKLIKPDDLLGLGVKNLPVTNPRPFNAKLTYLEMMLPKNDVITLHQQVKLPYDQAAARLKVEELLTDVLNQGGEGLILRDPNSYWTPKRVKALLKIKGIEDAEGIVVGYKAAELGKLHGMIGAIRISFQGKEFDLSGFKDAERKLGSRAESFCLSAPGSYLPNDLQSDIFPRGSRITFTYRELTVDGLPKEARYLRKPE